MVKLWVEEERSYKKTNRIRIEGIITGLKTLNPFWSWGRYPHPCPPLRTKFALKKEYKVKGHPPFWTCPHNNILKILPKVSCFLVIYPSQRQNLLLTLEIITHNFQNFQKIQNFGKKIPKPRIFSKIYKTVSAGASPVFFHEILSPSSPILGAIIENMISPDHVLY